MKAFLSAVGSALYERVFRAYKSTLLGVALYAGVVVLEQATTLLATIPEGWAKVVGAVLAAALALWKPRAPAPPVVAVK